ncbi:Hfq-related RNA-binding protein [Geminocystis sp. NIES-3709]|uniref:Hfq-related RNA-binding protein n=1 Tax=Geminocystis sp. NIES-3709 TaxID=1617448 RepID=UPI0008FFBD7A|nr:RNA chaperone Hfq [Geminocystis sp. NIES-3709]
MTVFNTGFPSVRQIQNFIKNKTSVDIALTTNETLRGVILWQDQNCLCLSNNNKEKLLISHHAIVYVKST